MNFEHIIVLTHCISDDSLMFILVIWRSDGDTLDRSRLTLKIKQINLYYSQCIISKLSWVRSHVTYRRGGDEGEGGGSKKEAHMHKVPLLWLELRSLETLRSVCSWKVN